MNVLKTICIGLVLFLIMYNWVMSYDGWDKFKMMIRDRLFHLGWKGPSHNKDNDL